MCIAISNADVSACNADTNSGIAYADTVDTSESNANPNAVTDGYADA
jgi:hypothetical protein